MIESGSQDHVLHVLVCFIFHRRKLVPIPVNENVNGLSDSTTQLERHYLPQIRRSYLDVRTSTHAKSVTQHKTDL